MTRGRWLVRRWTLPWTSHCQKKGTTCGRVCFGCARVETARRRWALRLSGCAHLRRGGTRGPSSLGTKNGRRAVHWCFSEVWGTVQFAAGADVVGACAERAENGSLPACALKFDDSRMRLLVGLCCQLQRVHGDSEFFLSCRDAGRVLGVRHEEAALMLRVLASDDVGILRVTKRPPRGSPKAIRYLFRGEV